MPRFPSPASRSPAVGWVRNAVGPAGRPEQQHRGQGLPAPDRCLGGYAQSFPEQQRGIRPLHQRTEACAGAMPQGRVAERGGELDRPLHQAGPVAIWSFIPARPLPRCVVPPGCSADAVQSGTPDSSASRWGRAAQDPCGTGRDQPALRLQGAGPVPLDRGLALWRRPLHQQDRGRVVVWRSDQALRR